MVVRNSPRSPGFCMNRVLSRGRARSLGGIESTPINAHEQHSDDLEANVGIGRKVLIVVDPSLEAKVAIQWAFSHSIQDEDIVVLLHVAKPAPKQGEETRREAHPRGYELLCNAKSMCHNRNPAVQVEVVLVEGKEKGAAIVEEAKRRGIPLIVLGQRNRSMVWRVVMRCWGMIKKSRMVIEYCIKNAEEDCMALAVSRNERLGGTYDGPGALKEELPEAHQKLLSQEGRDDAAEVEINDRGRDDDDEAKIDGRGKETVLLVQREIRIRCGFYLWLRKKKSLRQKSTTKGETMTMRAVMDGARRGEREGGRGRDAEVRRGRKRVQR
ncbi:hypothetical protein ACLOJK_038182 [Asimina triloba]